MVSMRGPKVGPKTFIFESVQKKKVIWRDKVQLGSLPTVAITLVFTAVVFVAGFLVLTGLDGDLTANSYAANASSDIQSGMGNVTNYASTWGTIIGVAVLLGIVIGGFAFSRSKGWL